MERHDVKEPRVIQLAWKYAASIYLRKHHCVLYRDDVLGVQKQVMTRRKTFIFPPKEKEYFFIDGIATVFRSEERLLSALVQLRRIPPTAHRVSGGSAPVQFQGRKTASDAI